MELDLSEDRLGKSRMNRSTSVLLFGLLIGFVDSKKKNPYLRTTLGVICDSKKLHYDFDMVERI